MDEQSRYLKILFFAELMAFSSAVMIFAINDVLEVALLVPYLFSYKRWQILQGQAQPVAEKSLQLWAALGAFAFLVIHPILAETGEMIFGPLRLLMILISLRWLSPPMTRGTRVTGLAIFFMAITAVGIDAHLWAALLMVSNALSVGLVLLLAPMLSIRLKEHQILKVKSRSALIANVCLAMLVLGVGVYLLIPPPSISWRQEKSYKSYVNRAYGKSEGLVTGIDSNIKFNQQGPIKNNPRSLAAVTFQNQIHLDQFFNGLYVAVERFDAYQRNQKRLIQGTHSHPWGFQPQHFIKRGRLQRKWQQGGQTLKIEFYNNLSAFHQFRNGFYRFGDFNEIMTLGGQQALLWSPMLYGDRMNYAGLDEAQRIPESAIQCDLLQPTLYRLLAEEITQGQGSDLGKMQALMRHFRAFTYSPGIDWAPDLHPVWEFLTVHKVGHCEFYASAFMMLARSLGYEARVVGGYHSNERLRDQPQTMLIRELHAHAWVEVLFRTRGGNLRWVVFDPTSMSSGLRNLELADNANALARLENWFDRHLRRYDSYHHQNRLQISAAWFKQVMPLIGALMVLLFLWRLDFKRRHPKLALRDLKKLQTTLGKAGFPLAKNQTLASLLPKTKGQNWHQEFEDFVGLYYEKRYREGQRQPSPRALIRKIKPEKARR